MAMVQGATQSQRSIVNNWKISNVLKLNYRLDDNYEFTLHGGGTYYLIKVSVKDLAIFMQEIII